jgi:hypothetical protein
MTRPEYFRTGFSLSVEGEAPLLGDVMGIARLLNSSNLTI